MIQAGFDVSPLTRILRIFSTDKWPAVIWEVKQFTVPTRFLNVPNVCKWVNQLGLSVR